MLELWNLRKDLVALQVCPRQSDRYSRGYGLPPCSVPHLDLHGLNCNGIALPSRCNRLSHSAQADANITCHGTGRRLDGSMTTSSQAVLTTACRTRSVPTTFERFPALRSERDQIAYHHKTSHQGLTPLLRISRARGQVWKQQGTALSHYAGHLQSEGKVRVKRCTAAQRHMA